MLQLLAVVWLENEEVENLLSSGDAIAHILFFPLLNGFTLPWLPEFFTKPLHIKVMPTVGSEHSTHWRQALFSVTLPLTYSVASRTQIHMVSESGVYLLLFVFSQSYNFYCQKQ